MSDRLRALELASAKFEAPAESLAARHEDTETRLRALEADRPDPTHEPRIGKLEQWK